MSTDELIADLEARIQPMMAALARLRALKAKEKSEEFIRVNSITRNDVEMSDGDGKPFFGHVVPYIKWLRANSKKRFAEWNGRIFFMSDLLSGRMPDDMPATIDDLPK